MIHYRIKGRFMVLSDILRQEKRASLICLHPDGASAERLNVKPMPTVAVKDPEINLPNRDIFPTPTSQII